MILYFNYSVYPYSNDNIEIRIQYIKNIKYGFQYIIMTDIRDYLIDWIHDEDSLRGAPHRYSYDEMIQRGLVIIFTYTPMMYYQEISAFCFRTGSDVFFRFASICDQT